MALLLIFIAPFLLSCGVGTEEPSASAQQGLVQAEQELVQAEEEVARVRAQLEVNPRSSTLWRRLLIAEPERAVAEMALEEPSSSEEDRYELKERVAKRILRTWKAEVPNSAGPWLIDAASPLQRGHRDHDILVLAKRFPDDPEAMLHAAHVLTRLGQRSQATELLESFLERRPEEPNAYRLLVGHYFEEGAVVPAREVAEEWLRRWPGDLGARAFWLRAHATVEDPETLRPRIEAMLATPVDPASMDTGMLQPGWMSKEIPVPDMAALCGRLLRMFDSTFRTLAQRCLSDLAAADNPEVRVQASHELLRDAARDGDWASVEETVRSLPEVDRGPALASALSASSDTEDCATQSMLALEHLSSHDLDERHSRGLGHFLVRCRGYSDARKLLLVRLADGEPLEARDLLEQWETARRSDRGAGPVGEEVASILLQRLDREPSSYALWRALDLAYQSNGALAEREQHLRRWIAAESSGTPSIRPYLELCELLASRGEDDAVIELLESAPPAWDQSEPILEHLLGALIRTGQAAEARALGTKILEGSPRRTTSPPHLLLARAAIAVGDTPTALRHYRAVLRRTFRPVPQRMAEEFLGLLLQQGEIKEQAYVRAAEETCRAPRSGSRMPAVQECIGDRLMRFGRPVEALPFYAEALKRAPNNASLRSKIASVPEPPER
ncbi:MAG: hypothetical protein SX243_07890 [Acidobacteriota bacterium]|nr:hypothetical protein [Acidobacteriota bacterium]